MCPTDDRPRLVDPNPGERGCEPFESRLEALVDGELSRAESDRVRRHVDRCAACRQRFELARAVKEELNSLPSADTPEHVVRAVLDASRAGAKGFGGDLSSAGERSSWRAVLQPLPMAAAAIAAALLVAAVWLVPSWLDEPSARRAATVASPDAEAVAVERAAVEARWALAYVSSVSRRTGERIRDDVIARRWIGSAARGLGVLRPQESTPNEDTEEVVGRHET